MHNSLETLPKPLLLKIISYVPNAKKELKLVSKTMYALTSDIFPSEINLTDRASKEQFTEELKGIEYIEAPKGDCFIETIIKYKDPIAYNKSTLRISLHDTGELKETNSDLFDALKENPSFLEKVYVLEISGNQYKKGTKIPFFPNLKKLSLTNTSLIEFEGDENFKDLT